MSRRPAPARSASARASSTGTAHRRLAILACAAELTAAGAGHAAAPAVVATAAVATYQQTTHRSVVILDTARCPSVPEGELRRLIALELGDLLAPTATTTTTMTAAADARPRPPSPARNEVALTIACAGDRATLRAQAASQSQPLQRTIGLGDFAEGAAPRGLALAGIELLATVDASVRERVGDVRPATPAANAALSMAVLGLRRQFVGSAGLGAWGGRLDLIRDHVRLRLIGDLEGAAAGTTTATSLGRARAFLGSMGAFAGAHFEPSAHLAWSLTAGARFGVARLQGDPDAASGAVGSAFWRPWGGPALSARGAVGGPRLSGVVSLELGYTALGAEALAATMTVLALRGPWLTAAAGLAF